MQVGITTASVPMRLVVPVTVLLARAGEATRLRSSARAEHSSVPVSLGLFDDADGLVQVTDRD